MWRTEAAGRVTTSLEARIGKAHRRPSVRQARPRPRSKAQRVEAVFGESLAGRIRNLPSTLWQQRLALGKGAGTGNRARAIPDFVCDGNGQLAVPEIQRRETLHLVDI